MSENRYIHAMPEEHTSTSPHAQFLSAPSPTTPEQIQRRIPLHWLMLGIALLAQITVSIVTQGVPILAPFLQADLGLTRGQVGLCNSAIMAGSLVSMFAAGMGAAGVGRS